MHPPKPPEHLLEPNHAAHLANACRRHVRARDECVSEVVAEFAEMREMRLTENVYSKPDVEALLDGLLVCVKAQMNRDLSARFGSNLLLIKQLFEQAEAANTSMQLDLDCVEDVRLLREVHEWEAALATGKLMQLRSSAAAGIKKSPASTADGSPAPIAVASDPKLLGELDDLRADKAGLEARLAQLELRASAGEVERAKLADEAEGLRAQCAGMSTSSAAVAGAVPELQGPVARLEAELRVARAARPPPPLPGASPSGGAATAELAEAKRRADDLAALLDEARAEIDARVEKTKQFANMRQMMAKKNATIKELRDKLVENGLLVPGDVTAAAE